MDIVKPIMFMAHIALKELDYVVEQLLNYNSVTTYLVCGEKEPYEHLHFVVHMSEKDYLAFSAKVFKRHFKLNGKATKDKARQYGRMKKINDLEKAYSYTVKENIPELRRTNLTPDQVDEYIIKSFKKDEKDEVMEWLKENPPPNHEISILGSSYNEQYDSHTELMHYKAQMRVYFAKMYDAIGAQKNMRHRFFKAIHELGYITTYQYVEIVYRI